jgi:hypothetical protein
MKTQDPMRVLAADAEMIEMENLIDMYGEAADAAAFAGSLPADIMPDVKADAVKARAALSMAMNKIIAHKFGVALAFKRVDEAEFQPISFPKMPDDMCDCKIGGCNCEAQHETIKEARRAPIRKYREKLRRKANPAWRAAMTPKQESELIRDNHELMDMGAFDGRVTAPFIEFRTKEDQDVFEANIDALKQKQFNPESIADIELLTNRLNIIEEYKADLQSLYSQYHVIDHKQDNGLIEKIRAKYNLTMWWDK